MNEQKLNPKNPQQETMEIDILSLCRALLDKIVFIVIVGIIGAVIAFAYTTFFIPNQYQASVKMYVNSSSISVGGTSLSISSGNLSVARSLVTTYVEILKTRSTLEKVIDAAELTDSNGNRMTFKSINGKVRASAVNDTEIFEIVVTDTDPIRAKLIANTIAEVLPDQISSIVEGSSVKTVDLAVTGVKSAPSRSRNTVIGFLVGAVIVAAIVVVRFLIDDYVHDEDYLLQNFDIPLLAVIPDLRRSNGRRYKKYGYKKYGYSRYGYKKYGKYGRYGKYGKYGSNYQNAYEEENR